jgi:hypothetical protein
MAHANIQGELPCSTDWEMPWQKQKLGIRWFNIWKTGLTEGHFQVVQKLPLEDTWKILVIIISPTNGDA